MLHFAASRYSINFTKYGKRKIRQKECETAVKEVAVPFKNRLKRRRKSI